MKQEIEKLLGEDIVSLEIQSVPGAQVVYLQYKNNIPEDAVVSHILSLYGEAEIGEVYRSYTEDVIREAYCLLYPDTNYDRYWDDPDVGYAIDKWLEGKTIKRMVSIVS